MESLHQKLLDEKETYKAAQVNVQVHAAKAWLFLAKGENEEALDFMRKAANLESKTSKHPVTPGEVLPADELLGDENLVIKEDVSISNYPNPFSTSTNIIYGIELPTPVRLEIYNILGQKVITLVDEIQNPNDYIVTWKGFNSKNRRVSSGIYIYVLKLNYEVGDEFLKQVVTDWCDRKIVNGMLSKNVSIK